MCGDGSLRQAALEAGIPILLYEGGEALRFDDVAIQGALKGIIAVMQEIGMLPKRAKSKPTIDTFVARSSTWVRAQQGGILQTRAKLGDRVSKGQVLGMITDPFGEHEIDVLSSTSGIIIGSLNLPLVNEGEALFHIARFDDPASIDQALDQFSDEFEPEDLI